MRARYLTYLSIYRLSTFDMRTNGCTIREHKHMLLQVRAIDMVNVASYVACCMWYHVRQHVLLNVRVLDLPHNDEDDRTDQQE